MEFILLIGLRAAGKTSFYRQRLAGGYVHVSMDLSHNNPQQALRQMQPIEQALQAVESVVVDDTSPTAEVRAPLVALGKRHNCAMAGYYFSPDGAASLKRNAGRDEKANVTAVAIYATRKKLHPPSSAEGFDVLYRVRIAADGACRVEPWVEEVADGPQ
jgi:predicted kinase